MPRRPEVPDFGTPGTPGTFGTSPTTAAAPDEVSPNESGANGGAGRAGRAGGAGSGGAAVARGSLLPLVALDQRALLPRYALLAAFTVLLLLTALVARVLGFHDGHFDPNRLFVLGGAVLPSTVLVAGWLVGRLPLVAVFLLTAGVFADEVASGRARLWAVRPGPRLAPHAARLAARLAAAWVWASAFMVLFDLLVLNTWAGPATLVLALAQVLIYGALVALLSVWTRLDWGIALLLVAAAMVWDAARRADALAGTPPGARELVTFLLPPQGALHNLELAFGTLQPIPWAAFAYAVVYAALILLLAGVALARREL